MLYIAPLASSDFGAVPITPSSSVPSAATARAAAGTLQVGKLRADGKATAATADVASFGHHCRPRAQAMQMCLLHSRHVARV